MADEPTTPTPPTPAKPTTSRKPAARKPTAAKSGKAPAGKPRAKTATAAKPATSKPTSARKPAAPRKTAATSSASSAKSKKAGPSFGLKTVIAAGLGTVGAVATAALLTLRGSSTKLAKNDHGSGHAEQADGTDSSGSFNAGIADEGTIPQG